MKKLIQLAKDLVKRKPLHPRSSEWPRVRKEHLKQEPHCAVCLGTAKLEVHHKVPFHVAPERELDPTNLVTLCESKKGGLNCHLFVGHLGNYKRVNRNIDQDIVMIRAQFLEREERHAA